MSLYFYRARDTQGALVTGQLDVLDLPQLKKSLSDQGLFPVRVRKISQPFQGFSFSQLFPKRVKREEILIFTRQFQTLFKAGLGMEAILSALIRQCRNKNFQEVLQKIRTDISGGASLASAFGKYPKVFSDLYIYMLAAGEEAGILEETLRYLADLLEKETTMKAAVKSATLYPKIVIVVLILAISLLMIVVVPKFAEFYAHYKAALPLPTMILIRISHFFLHQWYLLGGITALLIFLFHRFKKTVRGQLKLGHLSFRLPVFGAITLRVMNARFCNILSALYRSGLSITRSLEITSGAIENGAFRRDIEVLRTELTRGRSLSEGMGRCRYFLPVVVEATAAGEKAGTLDEMMESVGQHYETEVNHSIKNLTTLLEPILLVLIFGIVGLFALAIFLPVWNMSQLISG